PSRHPHRRPRPAYPRPRPAPQGRQAPPRAGPRRRSSLLIDDLGVDDVVVRRTLAGAVATRGPVATEPGGVTTGRGRGRRLLVEALAEALGDTDQLLRGVLDRLHVGPGQ